MNQSIPACILLFCAALTQVPLHAENLIENPHFEDEAAENGLPSGKAHFFCKPTDGYKAQIAPVGRKRSKGLLIEGDGEYGGVVLNKSDYDDLREYALRGWVRVKGDIKVSGTMKFDYFAEDGKWLGSTTAPSIDMEESREGWQLVSIVSEPGKYPGTATIGGVAVLTGSGKAAFDDVYMSERVPLKFGDNLLTNPNMEISSAGKPAYYYIRPNPEDAEFKAEITHTEKHDGWLGFHMEGNVNYAIACANRIKRKPGKRYVLTGWCKVGEGKARVKIDYVKDDEYMGHTACEPLTSESAADWQQATVTSDFANETFADATHLAAVLVIEGKASVWFDQLVLVEEDE